MSQVSVASSPTILPGLRCIVTGDVLRRTQQSVTVSAPHPPKECVTVIHTQTQLSTTRTVTPVFLRIIRRTAASGLLGFGCALTVSFARFQPWRSRKQWAGRATLQLIAISLRGLLWSFLVPKLAFVRIDIGMVTVSFLQSCLTTSFSCLFTRVERVFSSVGLTCSVIDTFTGAGRCCDVF